jgi:hypothetical protein
MRTLRNSSLKTFAFALAITLSSCASSDEQVENAESSEVSETPQISGQVSPDSSPQPGESTWDRYVERTFAEVIDAYKSRPRADTAGGYLIYPEVPCKVRAVYTGQTQEITPEKLDAITIWFKTVGLGEHIELFEKELLFYEGESKYWLPAQSELLPYFEDELDAGDEVTLFVTFIGAVVEPERIEWIFLLNEFLTQDSGLETPGLWSTYV